MKSNLDIMCRVFGRERRILRIMSVLEQSGSFSRGLLGKNMADRTGPFTRNTFGRLISIIIIFSIE